MKDPTLEEITNGIVVKNIFTNTLEEMLGIKGKYNIHSLSYPGWPIADHIARLSSEISKKMYEVGSNIGKERYKGFSGEKTKLTKDIVGDIWQSVSKLISEKIDQIVVGSEDSREIPGLAEGVKKGVIWSKDKGLFPRDGKPDVGREKEIGELRNQLIEKLSKLNDSEELLRQFRNNFFGYLQKEFDLYGEQNRERSMKLK